MKNFNHLGSENFLSIKKNLNKFSYCRHPVELLINHEFSHGLLNLNIIQSKERAGSSDYH